MEFPLFNTQHKQVEEEALFRFSSMISLEKAGVASGSESDVFKNIVEPLLTGDTTHRSITDNRIAFALLGRLLNPAGGPGRHLPQQSPHWLAFRRLFLAICERPIPKKILNLGIWEKRNQNAHQAQVTQLKNGWIVGEGWMDSLRSFLRTCHELLDVSSRQHHDKIADSDEHEIPPAQDQLEIEQKWTAYLRLLGDICDRLTDKVIHEEIESVDSRTPIYSFTLAPAKDLLRLHEQLLCPCLMMSGVIIAKIGHHSSGSIWKYVTSPFRRNFAKLASGTKRTKN